MISHPCSPAHCSKCRISLATPGTEIFEYFPTCGALELTNTRGNAEIRVLLTGKLFPFKNNPFQVMSSGAMYLHIYTFRCSSAYFIGGAMDLKATLVSSNVMDVNVVVFFYL